jgi:hypothetical protein
MPDARQRHDRKERLKWAGKDLQTADGRTVATMEPVPEYPGMWRLRGADGRQSDIGNLSRIRDAGPGFMDD